MLSAGRPSSATCAAAERLPRLAWRSILPRRPRRANWPPPAGFRRFPGRGRGGARCSSRLGMFGADRVVTAADGGERPRRRVRGAFQPVRDYFGARGRYVEKYFGGTGEAIATSAGRRSGQRLSAPLDRLGINSTRPSAPRRWGVGKPPRPCPWRSGAAESLEGREVAAGRVLRGVGMRMCWPARPSIPSNRLEIFKHRGFYRRPRAAPPPGVLRHLG